MKEHMFKLAGVKNEKDFYKKFPTEESFMKKHGKAFKAQFGFMGGFSSGVNAGATTGATSFGSVAGAGGGSSFSNIGNMMGMMGGGQSQQSTAKKEKGGGLKDMLDPGMALTKSLIKGYGNLRAQRRARKQAQQNTALSDLTADAAESIDVDARNQQSELIQDRYNAIMRPVDGEELFPVDGVGTNVLAQMGATVGRKASPMQRKQAEERAKAIKTKDSLQKAKIKKILEDPEFKNYSARKAQMGATVLDLSYVPSLDKQEIIEQKQHSTANINNPDGINFGKYGGLNYFRQGPLVNGEHTIENTPNYPWNIDAMNAAVENLRKVNPGIKLKAKYKKYSGGGFAAGASMYGGQINGMIGGIMKNDAGSQIGGDIGGAIGSIWGPAGQMVGKAIGTIGGGLLDRDAEKIKKANDRTKANMMRMAGINFGENVHAQNASFMQDGGLINGGGGEDITPIWGGDVEHFSENPYTPGGQTLMFEGPSHSEGGIGVHYAGNKIEAEGGEPAMKIAQNGLNEGLVIFGDLPISSSTAALLQDPEAKGKKFKTYVKSIAEKENKANRRKSIAEKVALSAEGNINRFDRLKLDTQEIISKGADEKLKQYAELKENAAFAQSAINDTAEELGIDPEILAKGGSRSEKLLNKLLNKRRLIIPEPKQYYAQDGDFITAAKKDFLPQSENAQGFYDGENLARFEEFKRRNSHWFDFTNFDPTNEEDVLRLQKEYNKIATGNKVKEDSLFGTQTGSMVVSPVIAPTVPPIKRDWLNIETGLKSLPKNLVKKRIDKETNNSDKENIDFTPYLNAIAPLIGKRSDAEGLDANQLLGEMYALSHNDIEPVYAQSYTPRLDVPYDISYQDSLNRNTSTAREALRMVRNNPAAIAAINAQRYAADQPILAQQFRDNQAKKDQVYSGNRNTLNDAQLRNLGIYDQQYVRQAQAKSNTKEATQAALNSISSKYLQNQLEQRTLKTYENMYNYRFGPNYNALNVNDPVDFKLMQRLAELNMLSPTINNSPSTREQSSEDYEYAYNDEGKLVKKSKRSTKQPSLSTPGYKPNKYGSMLKALKKY